MAIFHCYVSSPEGKSNRNPPFRPPFTVPHRAARPSQWTHRCAVGWSLPAAGFSLGPQLVKQTHHGDITDITTMGNMGYNRVIYNNHSNNSNNDIWYIYIWSPPLQDLHFQFSTGFCSIKCVFLRPIFSLNLRSWIKGDGHAHFCC